MTKNQFVPMDKTALVKEIKSIGTTGNRLNKRIQIAAINAVYYSVTEGYVQYCTNLMLSLNAGQRKNSLLAFLEKHGKVQWSKESKEFVFRKRDDVTVETVEAIVDLWCDAVKEPELASTVDFEDEAVRFLKKLEKQLKSATTIKGGEMYDYISDAVAQYHADQQVKADAEEPEGEMAE